MKATLFAFFISLAIFLTPETGLCAGQNTKIVTRIDTVTAVIKGGTLTVRVEGMASTPSLLGRGGELVKRGSGPNKDGLLEYELVFNPPQQNYTGDALKLVKTTLKVSSVPAGVKGVRIYAEYNEMNAMLPEPAPKKQEPVVVKKEEPVVAKKERPVAKKEELAPKKEEQEKKSQWWNPFHPKPAAPQVSAPPPAPKKQELVLKKKEPVVKKEEPVIAKKEKPTLKQEATTPKAEEKKSQWWNPFHRKPAASPVNPMSPEPKKPEPVLTKSELVVKKENPIVVKKEKPILKQEELAPKKPEATPPKAEEKKSQWWNPFHHKPAASPANATPLGSKKEELATKKREPAVTKEKPAPKKEDAAPKKEEIKKKSQWWNPFHRKPDAESSDESPR